MKSFTLLSVAGEERTKELIEVVLGRQPADLAIINAKTMNVYTGELLDNYSITVKGEWIAYVGDDPGGAIGPRTEVIDAKGKTVIPGLIDGHTHICWLYEISDFLKYVMKGGTTTIITETMEAYPIMGYEGTIELLASLSDQPVKIFGTAPSMVSISKSARGITREPLKKLLARDDILGLGEAYWQDVVREPEVFLPGFAETILSGKKLEGHSAGARGKKLMAYLAPGISSCHEPINAGEVLERLRLGIHVMIREGSIRRDLEDISKIKGSGIDLRKLILVTDGVEPVDLLEKGYMEFVVQKAIDCGFDPVDAVRMATINVAEHFSLDGIIGGIAPGKYADMLIIPDPGTISAEYVISRGRIVAMGGALLTQPRKHVFPEKIMNSVRFVRECKPSDFVIPVKKTSPSVKARVIDQVTDLVTREITVGLPIVNGEIKADSKKDILKAAAIDRRYVPEKMFVGLVRGFRLRDGAFACSAAWDTSDIIVVGENDEDMAGAVNRVYELQGGAVVCVGGEILSEIPLPVFGVMADMPVQMLAEKTKEITKVVKDLGFPFGNPLLTLVTLTGAAIPFLRICEEGLVDLKSGNTLPLIPA
jgi:adenine deaminase